MTTAQTSLNPDSTLIHESDRDYPAFLAQFQASFTALSASGPLFTTNATGLWEAYLDALPAAHRQYHTCHACRRFIETYGGLVSINTDGRTTPVLWSLVDGYYLPALIALRQIVARAEVTGVFLSKLTTWGQPVTGPWTHLAVTRPDADGFAHPLLTAGQAMAEKGQDYATVARALAEFTPAMLDTAVRLLESETLYRSEKVLGPIQWLRDLQRARDGKRGPIRDNLLWRAVALAPAGFCHPRASMAGTLLEDIAAGLEYAEISRRFAAKMRPDQYQRPQAAPSAGNIAEAEKIVEKLGITRSLERRYARLEELETLWRPAPPKPEPTTGGVFGHLKPKGATAAPQLTIPAITLTWEKFARTVLPGAETLEYFVPTWPGNYTAYVTAGHADAPPILQWDHPNRRNPVSSYVWTGGSSPQQWNLQPGVWRKVNAVTTNPAHWGDGAGFAHQQAHVSLILDGARDGNAEAAGNALFPETLKAELRAIRATIEAYSKNAKLAGREEASACGIAFSRGPAAWNALVRVCSVGVAQEYRIDRWD